MSEAKDEFYHDSTETAESITGYLSELCKGLQSGQLRVGRGEETLDLCPTQPMTLEVKAKRKRFKTKLTLKISWVRADVLSPSNGEGLGFSADVPVAEEDDETVLDTVEETVEEEPSTEDDLTEDNFEEELQEEKEKKNKKKKDKKKEEKKAKSQKKDDKKKKSTKKKKS